jgi:ankyrin repeat protein
MGADVNTLGRGGMTALMYAAINGHASTTKALAICCSADPFACDDSGQTAIEHAVQGGNTECIAILQMYASDRALLLGN